MVRPGGLELPTFWFVARRSIQLSYGRTVNVIIVAYPPEPFHHAHSLTLERFPLHSAQSLPALCAPPVKAPAKQSSQSRIPRAPNCSQHGRATKLTEGVREASTIPN